MDLEGIMLSEISQTKKNKLYDFICVWNIKKKNEQTKLIDTENRLVVARGEGKMGEGGQEVQTSSHKINKS